MTTLDLAVMNVYGRPIVQPTTAVTPGVNGVRPVTDPREASIPASALAARNSPELRQSVGPRQSSSTADTRDDEERSTVQGRGRSGGTSAPQPRPQSPEGDGRGEARHTAAQSC